jgi:hypothetical protein
MRHLRWSITAFVLLAACSGSPDTNDANDAAAATSSTAGSASATAPPMAKSPIDGVYRVTITADDGVAAGLTQRQAGEIDGEVETTFSFGTVRQFINGGVISDGFMGSFAVEGDTVILTDFEDVSLTLGYELHGKELTFTIVDDPAPSPGDAFDAALWTSHPFERR